MNQKSSAVLCKRNKKGFALKKKKKGNTATRVIKKQPAKNCTGLFICLKPNFAFKLSSTYDIQM